MPKFYSYPHHVIDIKDESIGNPLVMETLSLHRPLFIGYAEKGEMAKPFYGDYTELKKKFGAGTFDVFSDYYKHPNFFMEKCLTKNKVFFVRIADNTAEISSMVLECSIHAVSTIQYQKDVAGFRIVDGNDDFVPIDNAGSPLTEPGHTVKWSLRPLASGETLTNITQSTTNIPDPFGGADLTVTTFPVISFMATSPGAWGNVAGIKMFWSDESTESAAIGMEALINTIELVQVPYGFDNPATIRNKYMDKTTEFTFKEGTVDKATMRRYYLPEVVENEYPDVPFHFNVYSENVATIGAACIADEDVVEYDSLVDAEDVPLPYMVNLFTGKTYDGRHYSHIEVDTTSPDAILMDPDVIDYMAGGSDGTIDDATLEELTREWLTGNPYPDIIDSARYPVTHLYDSGYESATKEALIDFLGLKDDVKIVLSTQSVYEEPNIKSEDQSMGSYLRSKSLLHIESFIFGTEACRVTIFQQCGKLVELSNYTNIVPATLDCMLKKGTYHNATYIKGKSKGLPNSAVTVLRDVNWFPVQADFKQLSWDNALNYMQYYDMTSVHYPDVISVYPYQTSLLSDDTFIDMMVYLKHLVRIEWSKFVGLDDPINQLFGKITDSVGKSIYDTFGSYLRAEVRAYQTELDVELGYALHLEVAVYGTVPNRVWNVIIPVRRELTA